MLSSKPRVIAVAIAALLALIAIIALPRACASNTPDQADNASDEASTQAAGVSYPEGSSVVSFVAVGDNLPDDFIGFYADKLAGEEEDGTYDYKPLFAHIKPYVEAADLSYINQETHVGGNDTGPQGYPSFNTTDEMADAVVDAGFDFVASATNHSYDWGYFGALSHSLSVWEKQPVAFTGTAVTAEQYERIATQTCNGLKFALLNYTYGVNGFTQSELPPYSVNFIDKTRISADVQRAREQEGADVVLVAMHWGTENLTEADDDQKDLAQFLADLDVDVVLGSHPHVIGPLEWVKNSNGSGHQTLVAYSLGNFLADHEVPYDINVVEGMLSCDFVREPDSSSVQIRNIKWTPLVCHSTEDRDTFDIYTIDDYPSELAKKNRGLSEKKDPIAWVNEQSREIVGLEWFESA